MGKPLESCFFTIMCLILLLAACTNTTVDMPTSPSENRPVTHLNAATEVLLNKYLGRRQDSATITENALLRYIIEGDTIGLKERLEYETLGYTSGIRNTSKLDELLAIDEVRMVNGGHNIYKLMVSYSLSSTVLQIVITEDLISDKYQLKFLHFRFDVKDNTGYVDTIFTKKTIPIQKTEWIKFNELVDVALFWQTARFADDNKFLDGSGWTLEGLRKEHINDTKYHSLYIDSPEKCAFRDACEYLMSLSGEDLSSYQYY